MAVCKVDNTPISVIANVLTYLGYLVQGHLRDYPLPDNFDESCSLVSQLVEAYDAVPGQITPIITRDLAEQVISARLKQRKLRTSKRGRVFILPPALHCANCGSPMRGVVNRGSAFYRHKGMSCRFGHGSHRAEDLERKALYLFQALSLPPELVEFIKEKVKERTSQHPENAEVQKQIARLEAKLTRLRELYLEDDIDQSEYQSRKASIQTQIAEWETQLQLSDYDAASVIDKLDNFVELLAQGALAQQKDVINAVFTRIEVGLDGEIKKAEPRSWFQPLFADLAAILNDDLSCPESGLAADHH